MKKSESEDESECNSILEEQDARILRLEELVSVMQTTLKVVSEELIAMKDGDNTGFRHENDGGWFE